jgi:predicted lipoprotein with Yx(FWY)xxD motif
MEEVHGKGSPRRTAVRRRAAVLMAVAAVGTSSLLVAGAAGASSRAVKVTAVSTPVGKVLSVGGSTVYTLQANGTACAAACFTVWPPVMVPTGAKHPTAGRGVSASKLGTVKANGGLQVTYGGKRLYKFSGDSGSGQVNGDITDTWGKWSAVVISKAASHGGGSSGSGTPTTSSSNAGSGGASF